MTSKTLSSIVGVVDGLKPPTDLWVRECRSNTVGTWQWRTGTGLNYTGLTETAKINSATLTSVIDITGSGVFTFMGLIQGVSAGGVLDPKWRIIVDGVTALDVSGADMTDLTAPEQIYCCVGWLQGQSTTSVPVHMNQGFGALVFNDSINILIAGDGTDGVSILYNRYLT